MKLSLNGIRDKEAWQRAGIELPSYDVPALYERTKKAPVWVHFGIGNIFRIFIGGIADRLIEENLLDKGIVGVETFDFETVSRVYDPYDHLGISVILNNDGTMRKRVLGCFAEAIEGRPDLPSGMERLKTIFSDPGLQLVSFTITEKGYSLRKANGEYFDFVENDIRNGPDKASFAVSIVTKLLLERFRAGGYPLALVSMDNCSHNGEKLRDAVLEIAGKWQEKGFTDEAFLQYVENEKLVAFPWSMIDKITPRPSEDVAKMLGKDGVEDMDIVITDKRTYIAPFINAEGPQYLVIEDSFPNGRPPLEKAGVYMTDRLTVNKAERMKVTVCLNPLHTALAPYGCVLGFRLFSDEMKDRELSALARLVGQEGMEFADDPGILSPQAFLDECLNVRFPNPFLGDTPQRIAVDTSQMVAIRFGENIKACAAKYGDAKKLRGITLAIAGWIRYLLAVDDNGDTFELSPDPMIPELRAQLAGTAFGNPQSLGGKLQPILSNQRIFGMNLYEAGMGTSIEELVKEEISGPQSVRKTLIRYLLNE